MTLLSSLFTRDTTDRPCFVQTMLTMDAYDDETGTASLALHGLEVTELQLGDTVTATLDFSIECSLEADDLLVEAEYAARMVEQFEIISNEAIQARLNIAGNREKSAGAILDIEPEVFSRRPVDSFLEPQTTEELMLARIFCDVLVLPRVDVRDSFFVLGGDSLLSLRMIALARSIGYFLNVSHILQFKSVEKLATFLLSASSLDSAVVPPSKEPERGPVQLLPIQGCFLMKMSRHPIITTNRGCFNYGTTSIKQK